MPVSQEKDNADGEEEHHDDRGQDVSTSGSNFATRHEEKEHGCDEDDSCGDEQEDGFSGELAVVNLVEVTVVGNNVADVISPFQAEDGDWLRAEVPAMWRPV